MEAACLHGGLYITLILFYSQELPFLFAFTYDMVLHNILKCENQLYIILSNKAEHL